METFLTVVYKGHVFLILRGISSFQSIILISGLILVLKFLIISLEMSEGSTETSHFEMFKNINIMFCPNFRISKHLQIFLVRVLEYSSH